MSDSAADLKTEEMEAALHASLGDVREIMLAMQPSGNTENSDIAIGYGFGFLVYRNTKDCT